MHAGSLRGEIPVEVVAAPARVAIVPSNPNVADGGSVRLAAAAFTGGGYPVALPERLHWSATGGTIEPDGTYHAGKNDGTASVDIGGRSAVVRVTVGSHDVALSLSRARFSTVPRGGDGEVGADSSCAGCIYLSYALGPNERAAYAVLDEPLPEGTLGVGFRIRSADANGSAHLRVALRNAINEQVLVDAVPVGGGGSGWQDVAVRFPAGFAGPGRLTALYVVRDPSEPGATGTLVFGNLHAEVAGHS